jgi:hypothetical protein
MDENPLEFVSQESAQRVSWEPKEIKMKAADGSNFDLMDYIGNDCPVKKGTVCYLPVDDKCNDQDNREHRQNIAQRFKKSCLDAGFSVCIESWDSRCERINIVCTRGRKYRPQNKKGMRKRSTSKPILKEDVCPFRFNVNWFKKKGCWGIKAGYGERCHCGHGYISEASAGVSKKRGCKKAVSFFEEFNPMFQEICTMADSRDEYRRLLEKGMTELYEIVRRKYSEEKDQAKSPVILADKETNLVSLSAGKPSPASCRKRSREHLLDLESL